MNWEVFNEFVNMELKSEWLIFTIIAFLIFLGLFLFYVALYKSPLMNKVLYSHGLADEKEDEITPPHYHNTDTMLQHFNVDLDTPMTREEWEGKHFLFIPKGKVNTIKKDMNKIKVWYNGYSSKGMEYKVKSMPKDWQKNMLAKYRMSNYNGSLIIGNILIKTMHLTSIEFDLRDNRRVIIKYLFDNGVEQEQKRSTSEFLDDIFNKKVPYNTLFLQQCQKIELR